MQTLHTCKNWLTVVAWKLAFVENRQFWLVLFLIRETKQFSLRNCWNFSFFEDYGNIKKHAEISSYGKRNTRASWEKPFAKLSCSWNYWGLYSTSFRIDWGKDYQETVPGIQQDRVPHLGCAVEVRPNSSAPTNMDILQNDSGNILDYWRRKPGTKRGSFPEYSPS